MSLGSHKNRQKKDKVFVKTEPEVVPVPVSPHTSEGMRKMKKNKKRKLSETASEEEGLQIPPTATASSTEDSPSPSSKVVKKKKNKKQKQASIAELNVAAIQQRPKQSVLQISPKKKAVPVPVVGKGKQTLTTSGGASKKKFPAAVISTVPSVRSSARSLNHLFCSEPIKDSAAYGREVFEWLIHPTPTEKFFSEHWEKKPLHVKRTTRRDYFSWLMSSATLDDVMRENFIKFGKNIDITSYTDGVHETHNPEGRALPAVVWDYYSTGKSVRFLNPQNYIKPMWRLNASLQV